ncbi:hypothetical protein CASFOL_041860 [Castilleja foliolosa]|uniref:Pentatricopeptide repeat-containing protein n=1 Tax=Castilleja foliolosa TaxID=1961234 RepID=A0ABD3B9N0_9LAMI
MEVKAPIHHAKPAPFHLQNTRNKLLKLNPQFQTQLPLHRPEYKPIRIKPKNPKPKPVTTTTSDVLLLMDSLKLPIPADIYTSLIKECTKSGNSSKAIELYQHVRKSGLRLGLPFLNRVLLMYVSCGCFENARQLFDQMFLRDFNSWAIVISGCVENGEHDEAIKLFVKMLREKGFEKASDTQMGLSVSGILVRVLKACLCTMDFELGAQVHGWLWKMGYSKNVGLSSFLISYYGKANCFKGAESVFEHVRCRSTSLWTSRIMNYCNEYEFEEAIRVFKEMGREGVRKNEYTFSSVLKACRRMRDITIGRQVHANLMKLGLESDGYVHCALVDMYGKCGFIKDAARVFEIGRSYNESCNAMVKNYVRNGLRFEAIKVLYQMRVYGFEPCETVFDEVKLVCGGEVSENDVDEMYL